MNQNYYHKLISGQTKGFFPDVLKVALTLISRIYSIIIAFRNFLYDKNIFAIHNTKASVISIGNITAGGTGKTPLVIWLCNDLSKKNNSYAVLTRGYKTTQNDTDEPAIISENCPETQVIINPNRVIGAAKAIGEFNANVLVMDDGFQHRRLGRDIDIVTIDTTCPFGYGKIIPAGLLREPVNSLKRASAIVLTRCDQVDETQINQIETKLRSINPNIPIARSIHRLSYIKTIENENIDFEILKDKKVFAFCGIGNPNAFLNLVKDISRELVGSEIFDDHYNYQENSLIEIKEQAKNLGADIILTTQKDWTKISRLKAAKEAPMAYLAIEIKFLANEDKLRDLIQSVLAGKITRENK